MQVDHLFRVSRPARRLESADFSSQVSSSSLSTSTSLSISSRPLTLPPASSRSSSTSSLSSSSNDYPHKLAGSLGQVTWPRLCPSDSQFPLSVSLCPAQPFLIRLDHFEVSCYVSYLTCLKRMLFYIPRICPCPVAFSHRVSAGHRPLRNPQGPHLRSPQGSCQVLQDP